MAQLAKRSSALGLGVLLAGVLFGACGGLDDREVTRGPDGAGGSGGSGGSFAGTSGAASSDAGETSAGAPTSGGVPSSSDGGEAGQPSAGMTGVGGDGGAGEAGAGGAGGAGCMESGGCQGTPRLEVEETRLVFDSVPMNVESVPATVHVRNSGDASTAQIDIVVTGADAGAFTRASDTCSGFELAPGATCTFTISFKPAKVGASSASLEVSASAGGSVEVPMAGTGIAPSSLVFDPTSKVFGLTAVNGVSGAQVFTVRNTGGATAGSVTAITLSNPTDFKIAAAGNTCTGKTLGPGDSCTLSVSFEPKSLGQKSSTLQLTASAAPATLVNLSGQAGDPATLTAPASLAFGDVPNGANTDRTVSVGNSGHVATSMAVTATASGDFAVVGNTCTAPVPPGANQCTITVRVTPGALGARPGTLSLGAGNTTTTVALSATSKNPANVQISLSSPGKGAVGTDYTKNFVYTVGNTGELPTGPLSVSGSGNSHFSIIANTCNGVVVQPAQANACAFTVQFAPDGPTGSVSYMTTVSANPGGPKTVTATEVGTAACTTVGSHTPPCGMSEYCSNFHGCSPRGIDANTYCDSGNDYECLYGCDDEVYECCSGPQPCCPPGSPNVPGIMCP